MMKLLELTRTYVRKGKNINYLNIYLILIKFSLSIYKSEMCYEMAKFYYAYGNALTYKVNLNFFFNNSNNI